MTRSHRLIVFDLDGTLVDSRRDLADSANLLLAESGCGPLPEEEIGRMVGEGAAVLVSRAFAAARCPPPVDALSRFLSIYNRRLLEFTRPYPQIPEVLTALGGRARLAVLTNKPLGSTREILAGLGLSGHFAGEDVLGGDGPFPRKPDPAALRYLVERAGVELLDTVLVGDSMIDWQTARAAGVHICVAAYGFGVESLAATGISASDKVVQSPADLVSAL